MVTGRGGRQADQAQQQETTRKEISCFLLESSSLIPTSYEGTCLRGNMTYIPTWSV